MTKLKDHPQEKEEHIFKRLQETSRRAARTVDGRAGTYFHMFLFLSQRS